MCRIGEALGDDVVEEEDIVRGEGLPFFQGRRLVILAETLARRGEAFVGRPGDRAVANHYVRRAIGVDTIAFPARFLGRAGFAWTDGDVGDRNIARVLADLDAAADQGDAG